MTLDPLHAYKFSKRTPEQQQNWDEYWEMVEKKKAKVKKELNFKIDGGKSK